MNVHNHKTKIKLLLIEDNPADARLIQIALNEISASSYEIVVVDTIKEGLGKLTAEKFDVVISDLSLPDSEGIETIEKILDVDQDIPVIVMTGQNDMDVSIKAVQLGAQDYLIKGIGDGHLISRAIYYAIERKRVEAEMRHMAHYDSLTGLANRLLFRERLNHAILNARRNQSLVALVFIDLDRFKHINDTLGHDAGDQILIQVAKRLSGIIRETDTLSRLGGDEFMLILENVESTNAVTQVADKIIESFKLPCHIENQELYITPSIGVTLYPSDHDDAKELQKNADAAMYKAKDMGRNQYQFYSEEMTQDSIRRLDLESKLRQAIDKNELTLQYQPKFCIKTNAVTGAEALLRWKQAELGNISPAEYIPIAEETGLIIPIGEWVIDEVCRQQKQLMDEGYTNIKLAVNLSPEQFHNSEIADFILDKLMKYRINPQNFEIEITEGLLMENTDATISLLNKMKTWGLHISIDDFGTGYCSLGYIKQFPIDTLKIDRAFVKDLMTEPDDAAISEAIIALGHTLRLSVIAEGIETQDQLDFLRLHNCDEGQGYLFSKPLEIEDFKKLLKEKNTLSSNHDINPGGNILPIKRTGS